MADIDGPLDTNGKVAVNLPLDPTQAGHSQMAFLRGSTASVARVSNNGEQVVIQKSVLFRADFNGATAGTLLNNQFNQQNTTMVTALQSGFLRFNNGAITTLNTGVSVYSWGVFPVIAGAPLIARFSVKHLNGSMANKQFDIGFGFYDVAAAQAAAMNEFAGFRWTQAGTLLGVLDYSSGGASTTVTVEINAAGAPFSDNVTRDYEVILADGYVEFWVDGVFYDKINAPADMGGIFKASGYPIIARLFNTTAPVSAAVFDLGGATVLRQGGFAYDRATQQVLQGKHINTPQAGVQSANGMTATIPATGVSPTALVPSNTVSGLVGAGGLGRATMTGVALHAELIMNSFQNVVFPEAAGAAINGRNAIITGLMISPLMVSVLFAGGGFTAEWFYAYGGSALSLATADAIGAANIGTKSAKRVMLPILDTLAAAAAVGTIATRSGVPGHIPFSTPIPLAPGDFFHVGLRPWFVAAAVTAGAVEFGISLEGYWD